MGPPPFDPANPPPPPDADGGCGCGGPGGMGPHGPPPGDLDGGRPMGPPPGGGPGRPQGGGQGPAPIQPDPAAVQACHDTLDACVSAGTDLETCRQAEHRCMHDAFEAAFQAFCADAVAQCAASTSADCTAINARCTEGVDGRQPGGDGGLVCP